MTMVALRVWNGIMLEYCGDGHCDSSNRVWWMLSICMRPSEQLRLTSGGLLLTRTESRSHNTASGTVQNGKSDRRTYVTEPVNRDVFSFFNLLLFFSNLVRSFVMELTIRSEYGSLRMVVCAGGVEAQRNQCVQWPCCAV